MKSPNMQVAVVMAALLFAVAARAQEPSRPSATEQATASEARPAPLETIIPRLVKLSGTLLDAQERPMAGPVGVTFALYARQTGGAALWVETQNVKPDASGAYVVLLGANSASGVPAELFVSGGARWLGIQVGQQQKEMTMLSPRPFADIPCTTGALLVELRKWRRHRICATRVSCESRTGSSRLPSWPCSSADWKLSSRIRAFIGARPAT